MNEIIALLTTPTPAATYLGGKPSPWGSGFECSIEHVTLGMASMVWGKINTQTKGSKLPHTLRDRRTERHEGSPQAPLAEGHCTLLAGERIA